MGQSQIPFCVLYLQKLHLLMKSNYLRSQLHLNNCGKVIELMENSLNLWMYNTKNSKFIYQFYKRNKQTKVLCKYCSYNIEKFTLWITRVSIWKLKKKSWTSCKILKISMIKECGVCCRMPTASHPLQLQSKKFY